MTKHPGRWLAAAIIGFIAIALLGNWYFGTRVMGEVFLALAFVGGPVGALIKVRQTGTWPSVLTMIAAATAAGFTEWLLYLSGWAWWQMALASAFGAAPLMGMANSALRSDIERGQRRRDHAADALLRAVIDNGTAPTPFSLYLRPFATTERLRIQSTDSGPGHEDMPQHVDLETLLARALREQLPLLALGRPGDIREGAARIVTTDDDWRATMTSLARAADLIVMMPLAWESTQWELAWLVEQDLLGKVVMVMPEIITEPPSGVIWTRSNGDRLYDAGIQTWNEEEHTFDVVGGWTAAINAARALDIHLPPLASTGALFTLDPRTRTVDRILPLGLSTWARKQSYLREAIDHLRQNATAGSGRADIGSMLVRAVMYRGATLEYSLVRAADGYLLWSLPSITAELLRRAITDGGPKREFVTGYLGALPELVGARAAMADHEAVAAYRAGAAALLRSPELARLTSDDLRKRLDAA